MSHMYLSHIEVYTIQLLLPGAWPSVNSAMTSAFSARSHYLDAGLLLWEAIEDTTFANVTYALLVAALICRIRHD